MFCSIKPYNPPAIDTQMATNEPNELARVVTQVVVVEFAK